MNHHNMPQRRFAPVSRVFSRQIYEKKTFYQYVAPCVLQWQNLSRQKNGHDWNWEKLSVAMPTRNRNQHHAIPVSHGSSFMPKVPLASIWWDTIWISVPKGANHPFLPFPDMKSKQVQGSFSNRTGCQGKGFAAMPSKIFWLLFYSGSPTWMVKTEATSCDRLLAIWFSSLSDFSVSQPMTITALEASLHEVQNTHQNRSFDSHKGHHPS
jgi:hypothetical protein